MPTPRRTLACFAVAAPGLEPLVGDEPRSLGAMHPLELDEPEPGGVAFRTDLRGPYAANLHLRVASRVLVRIGAFHAAIEPPPGPGWIVTNPSYGVRVGERRRLRDLYAQFGNVVRRHCPGWEVALLSAHVELERQARLSLSSRFVTENGGIRVRLVQGRVPLPE